MKFTEILTNSAKDTTTAIIDKINRELVSAGNPVKNIGVKNVFSPEAYSNTQVSEELNRSVEELEATIETAFESFGIDVKSNFSENQRSAAIQAALALESRNEIVSHIDSYTAPADAIHVGMLGSGEVDVGRIKESLEAYDETENRNTLSLSYSYNLRAARQDQFGEAFFPSVTVAANVASVTITVDLLSVFEEQKHAIDGTFTEYWNRKSLVSALVYPNILNNDTTRMYPVVRPDPTTLSYFADPADVAPYTVVLENKETVDTAPLVVGKKFNYMGLCSPDYLIGQGKLDFTDQIDPSVQLTAIYIKLKSGEVIRYADLENMPEANYTYGVAGGNRVMRLNFNHRYIPLDATTTLVDGSPYTGAAATGNLKVQLEVNLTGELDLNHGVGRFGDGAVEVRKAFDNNKNEVALDKGAGKSVVDEFDGARVLYADIIARRVNTNRRERGQLLDLNTERMVYSLPILAPISIVRPATENDSRDGARLKSLITATYVRCSNAAVSTLLNAEKQLAMIGETMEPEKLYKSQVLGAARFFVNPTYLHDNLNVADTINTLRSADRMVDIQAVLINYIREMVYDAYLKSNYKSVADALEGENGNQKPHVIIGTDPYIAAYLQVAGDVRSLGDEFTFEVVSTPNVNFRNKIICVFSKKGAPASAVANPLHFGNMYWRPELTSILPISRNNTHSRELTVQPSFIHVVHCPVMISITVEKLPEAVKIMSPLMTKVAP